MKINLLREDQMTKVPHQDKEKEVLRFDDTFSGGNDDFYFQQPTPPSEEYKKPRKFRIWLFLLLLIVFLVAGALISNPRGTRDFFAHFGKNVVTLWRKGVDKIQTSWLHRKDRDVIYVTETPPAEVKEEVPEQQVIRVERKIEKEVLRETVEEKILDSPPVYEGIRDKLALSKRNLRAAEFVWSKVPGGMTLDQLNISEDRLSVSVKSRYPMLIQSYSNVIEQYEMFTSIFAGEPEETDEQTRVQLTSDLPAFRNEDRPDRIWDLDVEWFDDYLQIAGKNSDVQVTQELIGSRSLEEKILEHDLKLSVTGNRSSMMVFLQELQDIPAAFVVRDIASTYNETDQSNILEMALLYYERK